MVVRKLTFEEAERQARAGTTALTATFARTERDGYFRVTVDLHETADGVLGARTVLDGEIMTLADFNDALNALAEEHGAEVAGTKRI